MTLPAGQGVQLNVSPWEILPIGHKFHAKLNLLVILQN